MTTEQFEKVVQEVLERLPEHFAKKIDNVRVIVEPYPTQDVQEKTRSTKYSLLGLYQGIPLPYRNTWYGTTPTMPDTISLYQQNIEAQCETKEEIIEKIYEVLLHELGHYFGMNEKEIRSAMKHYQ